MSKMRYRLGLDVGTNSLGWAVLELDEKSKPFRIEAAGSRIFTDGRTEDKNKTTLKAERRSKRSMRRRRDRFLKRQRLLILEMQKAGLFPESKEKRKKLQEKDPLELRARAIREKLHPHEIGRAFFHINQRRGFLSNRKDTQAGKSGPINNAVKDTAQKLDGAKALTFGEYLFSLRERGGHTRFRPRNKEGDITYDDVKVDHYTLYPSRDMYKREFDVIWRKQQEIDPKILTDSARKRIWNAIFSQLPLQSQEPGPCAYLRGRQSAYRAMPSIQRYRMYQEVNNLSWSDSEGIFFVKDYPKARDAIIRLLEKPTRKDGKLTFDRMEAELKRLEVAEGAFKFNFQSAKRDGLKGNITSRLMRDPSRVGAQWDKWPEKKQDEFIAVIKSDMDDEDARKKLMGEEYKLSKSAADACFVAPLPNGVGSVSLEAATLLIEKMRDKYLLQSDAVSGVAKEREARGDFLDPNRGKKGGELLEQLPYYGEEFFKTEKHIIRGKRQDKHKDDLLKYYGGVTNPTVHIALNQIRMVVNEIMGRFGNPDSIAIELGRDLPQGAEYRRGIESVQSKNQKKNEDLDAELRQHNIAENFKNRLILRLWEEQKKICPYSGETICLSRLFTPEIEVDHIIPFSVSLDDSRANKVVCLTRENRYKGNRTPFQAYGGRDDWHAIFKRAEAIEHVAIVYDRETKKWVEDKKSKIWRFQENALDKLRRNHSDPLARHLNDTRYIGRIAKEYLQLICHANKIDVLTGHLTALLRGHWKLSRILHNSQNFADGAAPQKGKNRGDHRHHAIDAIVIAVTSKSILQKISAAANRAEDIKSHRLFEKTKDGKSAIDPWAGFAEEVEMVVSDMMVSHKPKRQKQGALHKEMAYGFEKDFAKKLTDEKEDKPVLADLIIRKKVSEFKSRKHLEEIRDPILQRKFVEEFATSGKKINEKLFYAKAKKDGIRRLRVLISRTAQPIRDPKTKKVYKGYWLRNNWATEVYEYPKGHKKEKEWEWATISRFHANKADFIPGVTFRPNRDMRLVMRLHANDYVKLDKYGIMRLHSISHNDLSFFKPEVALDKKKKKLDGDSENKSSGKAEGVGEEVNASSLRITSLSAFRDLNPRKAHISPCGRISLENRLKKRKKK